MRQVIVHPRADVPDEIFRKPHDAVCKVCSNDLRSHALHAFTDEPDRHSDDLVLYLVQDCEGNYWKL